MGIINIQRISVGAVGVSPGVVALLTTDNLSTITAAGYIKNNSAAGTLSPLDVVQAIYSYPNSPGTNGTYGVFTVSVSSGTNTLTPWVDSGNVLLPVTSGDIPVFNGTSGQIKDSGAAMSNASNTFFSTSAGSLTSGNIAQLGDANGSIANGPVAANKVLTSSITTPDVGANLISFDITVGQAALASGGSVTLQTSSGSKQYKIRALQFNGGGTNFSGGGGDRLGQITDGTTVYSVIPAAAMQTLVNSQWGVSALPNPASAAINTNTAAGAALVFKYSGGTTDYTAGSVVISGILQRVA